jgi:hypothetical protein
MSLSTPMRSTPFISAFAGDHSIDTKKAEIVANLNTRPPRLAI